MVPFHTYMLKEAQQEVIPRGRSLPEPAISQAGTPAQDTDTSMPDKARLIKALRGLMKEGQLAQVPGPEEKPEPPKPAMAAPPAKSEVEQPEPYKPNEAFKAFWNKTTEGSDKWGNPWTAEGRKQWQEMPDKQGRAYIEGLGLFDGYRNTREIQDTVAELRKNPSLIDSYGFTPSQKGAFLTANANPEAFKAARIHDQWKTEAWGKVKNYVKDNWQYILPVLAGAGMVAWGMSSSNDQEGARRPAWYENVNWRPQ